jgi:hypothetical protein
MSQVIVACHHGQNHGKIAGLLRAALTPEAKFCTEQIATLPQRLPRSTQRSDVYLNKRKNRLKQSPPRVSAYAQPFYSKRQSAAHAS